MDRFSRTFSLLNLLLAVALIGYAVYLLRLYNSGGVPAHVAISRPFAWAALLGFANVLRCVGAGEIRWGGVCVARAVQPKLYGWALVGFAVACTGVAAVAVSQW